MKLFGIKINLPAIAFVMAVGAAFAFRAPESANKLFRYDAASDSWSEITGQTMGVDYQCNAASIDCTAELVNDDPERGEPVEGTITSGQYQEL